MKFSQWLIMMVAFTVLITLPPFLGSDISAKIKQQNAVYTSYARSATRSAMSEAKRTNPNGPVFSSAEVRQRAIDAYYETLVECFNYEYSTYKDMVKYYTPCIFLIDNDGYYIEYTETYNDSGYATYTDVITTINKWTARYGSYLVEFHLDNTVSVIYDHAVYTGNYHDVYEKLDKPDELSWVSPEDTKPSFELDPEDFEQIKLEYIISEIQTKLEYYVNLHSEFFNSIGNRQYAFTLPKMKHDDWGRMLDMPTVIGFLQGKEIEYGGTLFNVFAFTGHELTEVTKYFIMKDTHTGEMYYHTDAHINAMGRKLKNYAPYTMEEAAKKGASPCPDCILRRRHYTETIK